METNYSDLDAQGANDQNSQDPESNQRDQQYSGSASGDQGLENQDYAQEEQGPGNRAQTNGNGNEDEDDDDDADLEDDELDTDTSDDDTWLEEEEEDDDDLRDA